MAFVSGLAKSTSISQRILLIRQERVILDADLAEFYDVRTKRLNEQVRRNQGRFPQDFVFQLTLLEKNEVVAKCDHLARLKFSKTLPFAFTEHGALMAAAVLNSHQAIEASVLIVRTFVELRKMLAEHTDLNRRLHYVENQLVKQKTQITSIIELLQQFATPAVEPQRRIGFTGNHPCSD